MKHPFRPLLLAALCWLLIALVPTTRSGLGRARQVAYPPPVSDSSIETNAALQVDAERRFPGDRRVQLDALMQATLFADVDEKKNRREIQRLAAQLGDDPVAITLLLGVRLKELKPNRDQGPLTNPNGPGGPPSQAKPKATSPRADWDRFFALARRGQKIEPHNSYYSWMILYGLLASSRDDEARAELKRAARLTQYDDHGRDMVLNRLAVTRLMWGSPLSVGDSYGALNANPFGSFAKIRQTTRWATECAIADRAANRHARALDTAFGILQMGRVMRRSSYSLIGVLVASATEQIPLKRLLSPISARTTLAPMPVGTKNPRVYFQQDSLYYYAQNHGRTDITRFINRESPELAQWRNRDGRSPSF